MVLGIGTDIIEIQRIKDAMASEGFARKYFTPAELETIKKKGAPSAAANFAGKEAVSKALGTGFRGFGPIHIEINRDALGKPYVTLYGGALERFHELNAAAVHISLSHSKSLAMAFVMIEGAER